MTQEELEQLAGYFEYDGQAAIAESIRSGTFPLQAISMVRARSKRLLNACQMADDLMAQEQGRKTA